MNFFWLISFCSSFFCFRLSLLFACILSLSLWYLSFVVVLLVPCFLLYTLNSSHYIIFIFLVFLYFVFCSHDAVCLFLCIFQYSLFEYLASFRFFKVMLSCGIVIFHSSPTNKTSAKTALIIFNIFTFSLFELLSVLAWAFFNKNHFAVFNTELTKRFHRVRTAFLGNFYCLDPPTPAFAKAGAVPGTTVGVELLQGSVAASTTHSGHSPLLQLRQATALCC